MVKECKECGRVHKKKVGDYGATYPYWCLSCGYGGHEPEEIDKHYKKTNHGNIKGV